jgi:hypothetical protein
MGTCRSRKDSGDSERASTMASGPVEISSATRPKPWRRPSERYCGQGKISSRGLSVTLRMAPTPIMFRPQRAP